MLTKSSVAAEHLEKLSSVRDLVLLLGGDLIEQTGQFPNQAWAVTGSTFQQIFDAATVLQEAILTLLEHFDTVTVYDAETNTVHVLPKGGATMPNGLSTAPFWLALSGVLLAYYMYMVNPALPAAIKRMALPVYTLLENKYYLDWFNENVLARGTRALGMGLWKIGDQQVIDGTLVNGSWKMVGWVSSIVRRLQSGYIYHYAFGMIIGVFLLMSFFISWPMLVEWLNK
jgi:NADH:ubiquinone oxidoreductase subunit 5 (subunit L)/multisubunit Na+/H+ antiporter MnhA subunit